MCLQLSCIDENLPPWLMLGDCLEKMKEIAAAAAASIFERKDIVTYLLVRA